MKKSAYLMMILLIIIPVSCKQTQAPPEETLPANGIMLTEDEIKGGIMTPEILWKFGRLGPFSLSPDGSSVIYTVTFTDLQTENRTTDLMKINLPGGEPVVLAACDGTSPQWYEEGERIAYVVDGELWTMDKNGSDRKKVNGISGFESFSISPTNDRICFTRRIKLDQTANEKHDLPKARVRIINDLMYRHWNSWSDYSYSHVFVASFTRGSVTNPVDIMEGQKFECPTAPYYDESEIAWSPDGKQIAYTSKRLKGIDDALSTNSDIFLYDIKSGKEINITEDNKGYDRYPVFSPDGSRIAFQSMARDGYEADLDRLFIFNIRDNKRTWLSKGWEFDTENVRWADDNNLFFTSAYLGTTQIFRISTSDSRVDKVTEGMHDMGPISLRSGVMIAGLTSMSMATELSKVDLATGEIKQLTFINKEIYDLIRMGRTEEKYIKTRDGKNLQMWIIYPPDFDPSKKYPAILFCNGGPQSTLGQFWSYRWNMQMIAANGYVVIAPNRRGNAGFGQEWKEQISGDYGGANINDYLDATDAISKEPFIDADRLGAVGASYGGYSVFYLAGVHGGRFKAFISHCGMFNFISWYGSTEELWFPNKDIEGPYWNKPKSYSYSPHLMVDNWDTPIMIITGANDFRIPYSQSLEAFQAAQLKNIPSRLLFFEDETHFVLKPQNAVIWQREFFEWLDTWLK